MVIFWIHFNKINIFQIQTIHTLLTYTTTIHIIYDVVCNIHNYFTTQYKLYTLPITVEWMYIISVLLCLSFCNLLCSRKIWGYSNTSQMIANLDDICQSVTKFVSVKISRVKYWQLTANSPTWKNSCTHVTNRA